MIIGVPKEIKLQEHRIGLTPESVKALTDKSHKVLVENNGGFVQAALNLAKSGDTIDASGYVGVRLVVRGNSEKYSVHLRTLDNDRPWQSYRASFTAFPRWKTISLPFVNFPPYRIEVPLDTTKLKRIGLVAIGRAFDADLALAEISFY